MRLKEAAAAVTNAFKPGVTQSAPTNTQVVLASQAEPEPTPDHGEKDGDGNLPGLLSLKGDQKRVRDEIAARRNAQAVADGAEDLPATDEDGQEVETNATAPEAEGADLDAEPQEQKPDAGATTVAAPQAPAVPAPVVEETREIIVEGKSVQVPLSKIVEMGTRTLQKDVSADLRLKQATQILEEAKKLTAAPAQDKAPPAESFADKSDEELAELIQFGTKEQAAQAVKALRSSAPVFKPEEIVRAAQQAVAPAIAFEEGKKFASAEYGDILSDPDLGSIFLKRENDARQAGDQRGYVELYKAIGDDMRVKFNKPKPGAPLPVAKPSTQPSRTMAEKQAAKAQAPAAPRLASQRLDGDGTQPAAPTRGEVIDRMRKARAFQPYAAQK